MCNLIKRYIPVYILQSLPMSFILTLLQSLPLPLSVSSITLSLSLIPLVPHILFDWTLSLFDGRGGTKWMRDMAVVIVRCLILFIGAMSCVLFTHAIVEYEISRWREWRWDREIYRKEVVVWSNSSIGR